MPSSMTPDTGVAGGDDLSALAWVHGELRRSLENAHKALRRYVRESDSIGASDVDAVDPSVLRNARVHIHQGVGALELVDLPAVAHALRASEAAVQRLIARPKLATVSAVETIEQLSHAVVDYLGRLLAGKSVSPLALFPQYAAAQVLAGADRVHPADLWAADFQWRQLPVDIDVPARQPDDDARGEMEFLTLAMMRSGDPGIQGRMSDLCAELSAGASGEQATMWQLAAAFFQGQAAGLVTPDIHTKRVGSRLLSMLRAASRGQADVSDRLAQDLLFYGVRAELPADTTAVPRLAALQTVWPGDPMARADYATPRLGLFDPGMVQQARKRVANAKDAWSAVSGGEMHRLAGLGEAFALLADSVQRLFPGGNGLGQVLQTASSQAISSKRQPSPELAMEVATAILYLDAALEDGELDHPVLAERVAHLAQRIQDVAAGAEAQPLNQWMEDLYRRVSDRQTMGSVVQELRASLSVVEKQIDQYFRDPSQRELLIPVPAQLQSMRGVLSVLGMDQASAAVLRMRDDVDALAETEVDPQRAVQTGTFDRLADNLGALSFLIDMLSVQPGLAKTLFRFDPATGNLSAVMGQSTRVSAFSAFDDTLVGAGERAAGAAAPSVGEAPVPTPPPPSSNVASSGLEDDAEMREIFLEEAREVVADARASMTRLGQPGSDGLSEMTNVRRAFHTLKGSARMVGLKPFGEAAWSCEQLYNARLAQGANMDNALQSLTEEALDYLADWVEAIASGVDIGHDPAAVASAADALRLEERHLPILPPAVVAGDDGLDELGVEAPEEPVQVNDLNETDAVADLGGITEPSQPSLQSLVPDLPSADDLALASPEDARPELTPDGAADDVPPWPSVPEVPGASEVASSDELPAAEDVLAPDFQLDLGALDTPEALADVPTLGIPTLELPTVDDVLDEAPAQEGQSPDTILEPEEVELSAADFDLEFSTPVEAEAPAQETVSDSEPIGEDRAAASIDQATASDEEEESFKIVGPLRIAIPLFNIFLNEADEQSRRLGIELAEWALEPHRPMGESAIALAHSLAGNSGTVGFSDLSMLARALEHALMRSRDVGHASDGEADLFNDAAIEIRRLLHQFAAGLLKPVDAELMLRLADHEITTSNPERDTESPELDDSILDDFDEQDELVSMPESSSGAEPSTAGTGGTDDIEFDIDSDTDAVDAIDRDLFPIFEEEADELLPELRARLSDWVRQPASTDAPAACMRTLHTFKGGARLAGAMRVGELAHRLETEIERLVAHDDASPADIEHLLGKADAMAALFDRLRQPDGASPVPALGVAAPAQPLPTPTPTQDLEPDPEVESEPLTELAADPEMEPEALAETILDPLGETLLGPLDDAVAEPEPVAPAPASVPAPVRPAPAIDWQRFTAANDKLLPIPGDESPAAAAGATAATVRVRAPLLDRLVNQAGEVSITRARIESSVQSMQGSLGDLTENLEKLRRHLRDIELQAETQISSRLEAAKSSAESFDPLEMDRFTRFQEVTRMMAESVNDVATVQRGLQRALQSSEDELASQARLTRDLQDDLLRTRMVEFESLADRLYRVVRLAAKETGKSVRLDLEGGSIEVDRGVLERMVGPFEHLLRNSVAHGIEAPKQRLTSGKPETGTITIAARQEGNEVAVEVRDDGGGLDLARIRKRAQDRGLLSPDSSPSDDELAQMIFLSGFSTAESVSGLAGRGVGMDVVRAEVNAMGGRIETLSQPGQGTSFRLVLPLTTAVTQVVMLGFGDRQIAVPSTLVEVVRRAKTDEIQQCYLSGRYEVDGQSLPFFWLGALLQVSGRGATVDRSQTVVVLRSASQRVAVHVDEVMGNQEVVVKNLGPQLSRLPGLAGITLLPSGAVAMIYNPVALATVYGDGARDRMLARPAEVQPSEPVPPTALAPLVMVVDDSLTVRRVTQRLLVREGYRVVLAKDGMDALERLAGERPALVLSDIEMPRMDGFDLVRNMRSDANLADLPVIMITSRIAQKHRDYAAELGVEHYLGKPYAEDQLLALVAQHVAADASL